MTAKSADGGGCLAVSEANIACGVQSEHVPAHRASCGAVVNHAVLNGHADRSANASGNVVARDTGQAGVEGSVHRAESDSSAGGQASVVAQVEVGLANGASCGSRVFSASGNTGGDGNAPADAGEVIVSVVADVAVVVVGKVLAVRNHADAVASVVVQVESAGALRASIGSTVTNAVVDADGDVDTLVVGKIESVGANSTSGSAGVHQAVADSETERNTGGSADDESAVALSAGVGSVVEVAAVDDSSDIDASVAGEVQIRSATNADSVDVVFAERNNSTQELASSVGGQIRVSCALAADTSCVVE